VLYFGFANLQSVHLGDWTRQTNKLTSTARAHSQSTLKIQRASMSVCSFLFSNSRNLHNFHIFHTFLKFQLLLSVPSGSGYCTTSGTVHVPQFENPCFKLLKRSIKNSLISCLSRLAIFSVLTCCVSGKKLYNWQLSGRRGWRKLSSLLKKYLSRNFLCKIHLHCSTSYL
jgi:hypothetical protein